MEVPSFFHRSLALLTVALVSFLHVFCGETPYAARAFQQEALEDTETNTNIYLPTYFLGDINAEEYKSVSAETAMQNAKPEGYTQQTATVVKGTTGKARRLLTRGLSALGLFLCIALVVSGFAKTVVPATDPATLPPAADNPKSLHVELGDMRKFAAAANRLHELVKDPCIGEIAQGISREVQAIESGKPAEAAGTEKSGILGTSRGSDRFQQATDSILSHLVIQMESLAEETYKKIDMIRQNAAQLKMIAEVASGESKKTQMALVNNVVADAEQHQHVIKELVKAFKNDASAPFIGVKEAAQLLESVVERTVTIQLRCSHTATMADSVASQRALSAGKLLKTAMQESQES